MNPSLSDTIHQPHISRNQKVTEKSEKGIEQSLELWTPSTKFSMDSYPCWVVQKLQPWKTIRSFLEENTRSIQKKLVHSKWWDMSLSCVDDGHHIDNAENNDTKGLQVRGPPTHPQCHHWLLPTIHDRRSHFHSAYNWLWSQPFAKRTIRTTALFTSSAEKWGWSVVQNIRTTQKYGWS